MHRIDTKRLKNPIWLTVLIMVVGALIGAVIGSLFVFAGLTMVTFGGFLLVLAQASVFLTVTIIAIPIWALIGGWMFGQFSSGSMGGVASRMGVTLFSETHPVSLRVNALAEDLNLPPIRWVGWFDDAAINAFATGIQREHALIAFSRGAVEKLTKEQLDAVMAHELAHVANNDMSRMTYARGVQDALTFLLVFRGLKKIARFLFTPTSEIEILRFSRSREYWADAVAAVLTSPDDMIGALEAIDADTDRPPRKQTRFANLMMRANAYSWLGTHPSLPSRIAAIETGKYTDKLPLSSD